MLAIALIPVAIYLIRRFTAFWFHRSITYVTERNKALKAEQKEKIEELKQSTNFYSTKALLERFDSSYTAPPGGPNTEHNKNANKPTRPGPRSRGHSAANIKTQQQQPRKADNGAAPNPKRSSFIAQDFEFSPNIPSLQSAQGDPAAPTHITPQQQQQIIQQQLQQTPPASLAPVHNIAYQPRWYDRILDVIVGEDEYSPKSRYALICVSCRNHNGLAQPGELPQYVIYICPRCGYRNGEEKKKRSVSAKHIAATATTTPTNNTDNEEEEEPTTVSKPLKFDTSGFEKHESDDEGDSDGYGHDHDDSSASAPGKPAQNSSTRNTPTKADRVSKHKKRLSTTVAASLNFENDDGTDEDSNATSSSKAKSDSLPKRRKPHGH